MEMSKKISLSIVLLLVFASISFGATYYISWDSGDDSRTTTEAQSKSTPWKHVPGMDGATGTVASYTPQPGDSFVFKGGETWLLDIEGDLDAGGDRIGWIMQGSGTSGNEIIYTADETWYSGASFTQPVIKPLYSPLITFYTDNTVTNITNANPAIVTAPSHTIYTGNSVSFKNVGGMTEINRLKGTATVIDSNTFSVDIDTTSFGSYTSGGITGRISQAYVLRVYGNSYWTFDNLKFGATGASGTLPQNHPLHLTGVSHVTIQNCTFDCYDGHAIVHNAGSSYETVRNCSFVNNTNCLEFYYNDPGVHNLDISYNTFGSIVDVNLNSPHADAVQFWDGDGVDSYLTNFSFHHNKMTGDWGTSDTVTTGMNSLMMIQNSFGHPIEGPVLVYDNVIEPTFSDPDGGFIVNAIFVFEGAMNVSVYNNSFIRGSTQDVYKSVFRLNPEDVSGYNYTLKNNLFYNISANMVYWFLNNAPDPDDPNTTIDYNIYYDVGELAYLDGYKDWSEWTSYGGGKYDQHSYLSDPNLNSSGVPQPTSDAIDKGTDLSAFFSDDYLGVSRPYGSAWDIGAYEYNGGGGDTTPPVMSSGGPSGKLTCLTVPRKVTLTVTTDEIATCKYDTSDTDYDSMTGTFTTTGGTSHSTALWLSCGADYNYYIRCMDWSNNKNTSSEHVSFTLKSVRRPVLAGPNAITVSGVPVGK